MAFDTSIKGILKGVGVILATLVVISLVAILCFMLLFAYGMSNMDTTDRYECDRYLGRNSWPPSENISENQTSVTEVGYDYPHSLEITNFSELDPAQQQELERVLPSGMIRYEYDPRLPTGIVRYNETLYRCGIITVE